MASDGHILDIFGPYPTTSEADIMKALLQDEDSETQYFFTEGDVSWTEAFVIQYYYWKEKDMLYTSLNLYYKEKNLYYKEKKTKI